MVQLSNAEFERLTEDQSLRLKALAKKRCDRSPKGELGPKDLDEMIKFCAYCGDSSSTRWLKSLKMLLASGEIDKIKKGEDGFEVHRAQVSYMHKKGEIAFDIFDSIILKENGKRGIVVDYNQDSKEFIVQLNPFQIQSYPKDDLEKVAVRG